MQILKILQNILIIIVTILAIIIFIRISYKVYIHNLENKLEKLKELRNTNEEYFTKYEETLDLLKTLKGE